MQNKNNKQTKTVLILSLILMLVFGISHLRAEAPAELESAWQKFQESLPEFILRHKLMEPIETGGIIAQHKAGINKLTEEPFLRVEGFDYFYAIQMKIELAEKNIQTLKVSSEQTISAAENLGNVNFQEKLDTLDEIDEEILITINNNLQLYQELFQSYRGITEPGGSIEQLKEGITELKQKAEKHLNNREAVITEYQNIIAELKKEVDQNSLKEAADKMNSTVNALDISEFIELINNWYNDPETPISTSNLDLLIDHLFGLFNEEIQSTPTGSPEKIYFAESMIDKKLQNLIEQANQAQERIIKPYQKYSIFFNSDKLLFLLDASISEEKLISYYIINGSKVAQGWQPSGTWNYPLTYKIKGIRGKLYSMEKLLLGNDNFIELVEVNSAVSKLLPEIKFISAEENKLLVDLLKKLNQELIDAKNLKDEITRLVGLMKEDEQKERKQIEEINASIDRLTSEAQVRFKKISGEIEKDVYLNTDTTEFKMFLNKEQKQIEEYTAKIFLIQTEGVKDKVDHAVNILTKASKGLLDKLTARKSGKYEGEYNRKLVPQIKELEQKLDALLKITDKKELTKMYQRLQKELRAIKRGNTVRTKAGETLVLKRSQKNETAVKSLDDKWLQSRFYYYKNTTKPSLSAVKIDGMELTGSQHSLPEGKTEVEITGKASVGYAASKNGINVDRVEFSIDGGKNFQTAVGKLEWSFKLTVNPGRLTLVIKSIDNTGSASEPVQMTLDVPIPPGQPEDDESKDLKKIQALESAKMDTKQNEKKE